MSKIEAILKNINDYILEKTNLNVAVVKNRSEYFNAYDYVFFPIIDGKIDKSRPIGERIGGTYFRIGEIGRIFELIIGINCFNMLNYKENQYDLKEKFNSFIKNKKNNYKKY